MGALDLRDAAKKGYVGLRLGVRRKVGYVKAMVDSTGVGEGNFLAFLVFGNRDVVHVRKGGIEA
jgi:hypothetical protein